MNNTVFSLWPSYSEEEAKAVYKTLSSGHVNYWTGSEGREFEKEFAAFVNCDYAVAVSNGTVALELALKALDLPAGSEVIVTPRTFIASISAIVLCGLKPVFADVDLQSQNITAKTIAQVLTKKTRAIICVHLAGWPCEMDEIMALANDHNLLVVEDCAQAHGAIYKGKSVGSFGHVAAWSFCQDKIMTTGGEGGMVATNDEALWKRMWAYKDHGKSWDAVYSTEQSFGFRWLHESFGTNWRMMEMQATIGRIQLKLMGEWSEQRNANAIAINQCCKKIDGLRVTEWPNYITHGCYKHYVFIRPDLLKNNWNREQIIKAITALGVPCFQGSCSEVYLESAFDSTDFRPAERLPNARELGETSLMFLVHPTLTKAEIVKTGSAIEQVMAEAFF